MNVILNGFHKEVYFPLLHQISERFGFDTCHIIFEDKKNPCGRKCFYYQCAVLSHQFDYQVEQTKLLPLDEELLRDLSDCEAVVLQMMQRDEIRGAWSYEKRLAAYKTHLRYWNHVIETDKIQLFLTSNIPHVVYDYIIYALCKRKKIKTVFLYQFQPGLSFAMSDWRDPIPGIAERFWEITQKAESEIRLPPRLAQEWDKFVINNERKSPFYMRNSTGSQEYRPREEFGRLLRGIVKAQWKHPWRFLFHWKDIVENFLSNARSILEKSRDLKLSRRYDVLAKEPDLSTPYVYFPLHLQPELSTSPMAGAFVDQSLIVSMLSYHLPSECRILVKEHPNQDLRFRNENFYSDILRNKNVSLVPRRFDTFALIENSRAVVTCTGTAGWEGFLRKKNVLLFGNTFFQDAPGVFKISSNRDCREAVEKIFSGNSKITASLIKSFLKALEPAAIFGDIDPDYIDHSEVNSSISVEKLFEALGDLVERE